MAGDGDGDLRYEPHTGLGRMDILLTFKGRKYIIETKVNHRNDITAILDQGIAQVTEKYLLTESADEGYLVIFDTATPAGAANKPQVHEKNNKKIIAFITGIGYSEKIKGKSSRK